MMKLSNSALLLLMIAFVMSGFPMTTHGQANPIPRQRNVLLIISDDQGVEMAGSYGNRQVKTPNLDRLASEGVRFTQAFATVASCSPSRSVLYSGLHQHTNGMYGLAHDMHHQSSFNNVRSLPRTLKDNGYRTGLIGKYHVAPREVFPFDVLIAEGDSFEVGNASGAQPEASKTKDIQGNRGGLQMAQLAGEFISASADNPFFLVVAYSDPHRTPIGFGNDKQYAGIDKTRFKPTDVIVPYHLPDTPEVRGELAEYYEAVNRLDQSVGLLLKSLEQSGKADDTLVIYLSDNGIPFPGAKTTLYDAGLHLPLIVRRPNLTKRGTTNNAMVSWTDITPTILEWANTAPSTKLPGRSLLPILEQENPVGWDAVFASHTLHEITMYYPMRAVRTRRHKLIWNLAHGLPFPHALDLYRSPTWQGILKRKNKFMGERTVDAYIHRPEYELYDLERDPHELRDLAGDAAYAKVFINLQAQLRKMMHDTQDPWVVNFEREVPSSPSKF